MQIIASDIQPMQNTSTTRYLKETLKLDDARLSAWLREWITRGLDAFNALPDSAKRLVYRRLWMVLSAQDKNQRYAQLSAADRQAIVEILRETKKEVADYFK